MLGMLPNGGNNQEVIPWRACSKLCHGREAYKGEPSSLASAFLPDTSHAMRHVARTAWHGLH